MVCPSSCPRFSWTNAENRGATTCTNHCHSRREHGKGPQPTGYGPTPSPERPKRSAEPRDLTSPSATGEPAGLNELLPHSWKLASRAVPPQAHRPVRAEAPSAARPGCCDPGFTLPRRRPRQQRRPRGLATARQANQRGFPRATDRISFEISSRLNRQEPRMTSIARPGKIIALHLNYRSRAAQRGRLPEQPSYFLKPATSVAASGTALERPAGTELLGFEGEIALVIGRTARRVTPEHGWSYVGGVTAANDFGLYDLRYADRG